MAIRFPRLFAVLAVLAVALVLTGVVSPAMGQQKAVGAKTASKTAPKPEGITLDGVIAMVENQLSDDVIIAKLRKESKSFDLSTDDLIRLKKAKVSDAVMRVMMDPKAELSPPPAPPVSQPVVMQTPVMPVIPGIRGISNAGLSGATPAPGAEAKGDPNDPMMPHDSGIYLMTKDREGKPQLIVLERASYQGSKSGGFLASGMTYGIIKAKTKAMIAGPHASIRVSDPAPVFYFYFEDKQAGLGKTYFGVGNLSNPNQFALLKLAVTREGRESTVGQFSALGSSSGNDSKAMIPFKSERVRAGLYKVVVESMKSGEYCFVASSNMGVQAPYGATATMTTDIFDFGVGIE